jgi:hypothetical protein
MLALALGVALLGRARAELQDPDGGAHLEELRRREWEGLLERAAGTAEPGALRAVRLQLVRSLVADGRTRSAARLAAELLLDDAPPELAERRELLALALAEGAASELDARAATFGDAGFLDAPTRLALAEAWLLRGALPAIDRVLAPFRDGAPDPSGEAAALRAQVALARGRIVAARALLSRVLDAPQRAGGRGALALLLGAEDALERGESVEAGKLATAAEPALLQTAQERARLALVRAALARHRGAAADATRELATAEGELDAALSLAIAVKASRDALARGAPAEAAALAARAEALDVSAAGTRRALWALRGELALVRGEPAAARAAFERALERGRWSGGGAAGEALEGWAALLVGDAVRDGSDAAAWLGLPVPAPRDRSIEVVLRGPRRTYLAQWDETGLVVRALDAEEAAARGPGGRLLENPREVDAAGEPAAPPHALVLESTQLAAQLDERDAAREEGRDFLGFGGILPRSAEEVPIVEDELRAVAQCFPSAEQHLHLGVEATFERLRGASGRGAFGGGERRYRVLHLVARAEPAAAAAHLAVRDAEDRLLELDLALVDEMGAPVLPRADLCVLSLYAEGERELAALSRAQLEPWVSSLLAHGARSVLLGVRTFERDEEARRELGHFYAALAEGESAAHAVARSRAKALAADDAADREEPIFTLYGEGSLRARGWSPPDLAVLAPEAVRRPWWVYFVTALVLPAVVFLLFRRLSTGQLRART